MASKKIQSDILALLGLGHRFGQKGGDKTKSGVAATEAVAAIEQRHYLVNDSDKFAALTRLFKVEPIASALIFVRTRAGCGALAAELSARGLPAEALSGELEWLRS